MFELTGRVAFITGASRGFGRAIAKALSGAGADVALFARTAEALKETAELVKANGRKALALPGDITDRRQVDQAIAETVAEFGHLDILINNAGVAVRKPIEELTDEDWLRVFNTNVNGTFYCTRAAIPHMKKGNWGRIVNLGSMMGSVSLPERSAYTGSKAAIHGLTRTWALEFGPYNITVNTIAAGTFATEFNAAAINDPVKNQFYMDRVPIRRWGTAEELAALALYLCSEEAAYMNGAIIPLDAGWTAE